MRRTPDRYTVQIGPVGLSFSWIRGRSNSIADGQLLVIEWSGQLGEQHAPADPRNAMPAFEHVLQPHATSPEDWQWRRADIDLCCYTTRDLAEQCVASVARRCRVGADLRGRARRRRNRAETLTSTAGTRASARAPPRERRLRLASSGLDSTRSISAAMRAISAAPMPRVVTADVPMRMPLVTNGDWVSFGTVFLLTVIAASSSASCATFPVRCAAIAQVDEHQVIVSSAGHDLESMRHERLGKRARVRDDAAVRTSLNDGSSASLKQTAFAAMTCSSGPP